MKLSDRLDKRARTNPNNLNPANWTMKFILDRLHEHSTWRGIILFLAGVGVAIPNEYHEAIIAVALSLVGLINIFRASKP